MYLLTPFILQIFKKVLEWIQSYEDAPFLGPKGSICPKQTLIWPFLTIFGRFCPLIFFLKNPALSHTTIYEPPTPCQVSEKTTELIPRENTDRRKDGWTDPILQDPSGRGRESNKKRMCFFQLLYLESGYFIFYLQLTLRQLIQPDLESRFIVRSQYLVRLLSQCWITGGHTIHPPIKGLLPSTGIEPTPFRNSASKVAVVHATTPGISQNKIFVNPSQCPLFQFLKVF